jgi:alkylated DNA repair dioxygenase AlkB
VSTLHVARQTTLFDLEVRIDETFASLRRVQLDDVSWVDYAPGWVTGDGSLFDELVATVQWDQRTRWMYTREVSEPRLTARWEPAAGGPIGLMRALLTARYDRPFDSVGINLYRDGRDSVAWHRDRIPAALQEPVVALVSLGEPRQFALRPKDPPRGGRTHRWALGHGDLLVTGGLCQRRWEHSVPKTASAGPRMSLAFRHSG